MYQKVEKIAVFDIVSVNPREISDYRDRIQTPSLIYP